MLNMTDQIGEAMAKGRIIGTRMDPIEAKRVELRANELGLTLSGYIRYLIEADRLQGGHGDALAKIDAEVSIVTGFMVRRLLNHVFGDEDGKKIEQAAQERAASIVQDELDKGKYRR